jgi:aspartyl-tRNA(Asn)/glutamyl-tRNA(Gln) amidotransferase subunit C
MSLTLADVTKIARLARIELAPGESEKTLSQLNGIFALIEKMRATDTSGVAPLTTPLAAIDEPSLRLRADRVSEVDQRELYQSNAPAVADGLYLVPKVIE